MPLKKFLPSKSNFVSLGGTRINSQTFVPTPGPVLVPNNPTPTPPPTGGAFSSAFSNAFDN
jgi:hypothetical protein